MLKKVHDVSGAGGTNASLCGNRDKKRFQVLQMGKYFLRNYRNKVSFFISLSSQELSPSHKTPSHTPVPPHLCGMRGQRKRLKEGKGKGQGPFQLIKGGTETQLS